MISSQFSNFNCVKKLFIIFLLSFAFTVIANAQDYKKFKVELGLGVALNPGLLIALEPAYRIDDDLAIGLRIEGAMVLIDDGNFNYLRSYTLNGQYYLSDKRYRWFMGTGLGLYNVSGDFIDGVTSAFGFYPRVGYDLGHSTLAFDYNFITVSKGSQVGTRSYLGLRVGFIFGGGHKEFPQTND
jgi:hypothetical protein